MLDAWDKSPILTQDTLGPQVAVERLASWKSPGCHRCLVAPETLNNQSLHIRGKLLNKREKPSELFSYENLLEKENQRAELTVQGIPILLQA